MPAADMTATQTAGIANVHKPMLTAGIADLILDILEELQSGCTGMDGSALAPSLLLLGPPGTGHQLPTRVILAQPLLALCCWLACCCTSVSLAGQHQGCRSPGAVQ